MRSFIAEWENNFTYREKLGHKHRRAQINRNKILLTFS